MNVDVFSTQKNSSLFTDIQARWRRWTSTTNSTKTSKQNPKSTIIRQNPIIKNKREENRESMERSCSQVRICSGTKPCPTPISRWCSFSLSRSFFDFFLFWTFYSCGNFDRKHKKLNPKLFVFRSMDNKKYLISIPGSRISIEFRYWFFLSNNQGLERRWPWV